MNEIIHCETFLVITTKVEREKKGVKMCVNN